MSHRELINRRLDDGSFRRAVFARYTARVGPSGAPGGHKNSCAGPRQPHRSGRMEAAPRESYGGVASTPLDRRMVATVGSWSISGRPTLQGATRARPDRQPLRGRTGRGLQALRSRKPPRESSRRNRGRDRDAVSKIPIRNLRPSRINLILRLAFFRAQAVYDWHFRARFDAQTAEA
jgi:hypothetical protein